MRFARLFAILLGLPMMALAQSKSPTSGLLDSLTTNIDIQGLQTTYDPDTGIATAIGEVNIKYGDTEIECGRADYNANTGDVLAKEHVILSKAGVIYRGEDIVYNVNSGELHGNMVRSGLTHNDGTIFYTTDKVETASKYVDRVDGENALITTHDLANPNYHFTAKSMTIYPNDRLIMRSVTVYAGSTPVMWFPYVTQPLDDENGYLFSPGYSSNWGAYLTNQYAVIFGDHTLAKFKLDLRSKRGIGGGVDLISLKQKDNVNWGKLKIYGVNDLSPLTNKAGENRIGIPTDRYRVNFQHRIYLTGPADRTWFLDFDINKMSDQFFLEDFFLTEFVEDREPNNQVSLIRSDPRYTATLMAKFQLNKFYRTDTRLPELAFDFTRQPIFNTGLYYQGATSFDVLRENLGSVERDLAVAQQKAGTKIEEAVADGDGHRTALIEGTNLSNSYYNQLLGAAPATVLLNDDVAAGLAKLHDFLSTDGFNRLYSYHEVLYPKKLFGWLNLVPRVGFGLAEYSDIKGSTNPDLSSATRTLTHLGLDASFRFSKTWDDVHSDTFGLDGIKHTVQPYVNYSYLDATRIDGLPEIDRNVVTSRPLPLDIPLYSGIDSLSSWNIARVGVRNLLQTKRDYTSFDSSSNTGLSSGGDETQSYSWAGLNTYVDVFFQDPLLNRKTSNLYNELFWRPVPWVSFSADTQLPLGGPDAYTEANYGITFMPNKSISFTIGHEYINSDPLFTNSSLIYTRFYARLSDNWGFSMNHVYEATDHTLEYQSYSFHRDLNSWVASFGFLQRDNGGTKDIGVIFSFTLKDFPQVSVPLDTDPNPTGRSLD